MENNTHLLLGNRHITIAGTSCVGLYNICGPHVLKEKLCCMLQVVSSKGPKSVIM